jgi:hypothetical protein
MTLQEQQFLFAKDVAKLINYIASLGLWVTLDEAYRTPEQAQIYAEKGIGIADSLHCKRLAIDLNVYKDGNYLYYPKDYIVFGKYWEQLDRQNRSGCWFTDSNGKPKPDARHFERRLL